MTYYKECDESEATHKTMAYSTNIVPVYADVIEPFTKPKFVGLFKMVGNESVLMEFRDFSKTLWTLGSLESASATSEYQTTDGEVYAQCRFSDRWQVWQGGECPYPEGVEIELIYRDGNTALIGSHQSHRWEHLYKSGDIIACRFVSLADGYQYEWESQ